MARKAHIKSTTIQMSMGPVEPARLALCDACGERCCRCGKPSTTHYKGSDNQLYCNERKTEESWIEDKPRFREQIKLRRDPGHAGSRRNRGFTEL